MATLSVTLHAVAFESAAVSGHIDGNRNAYTLSVDITDAKQAEVDAGHGKQVLLTGIPVVAWTITRGLHGAATPLPSPPSHVNLTVGQVTADHLADGRRALWVDMTPPEAAHATRFLAWETVGTDWQPDETADLDDPLPADFDLPGTGLLGLFYMNRSVSGQPVWSKVMDPIWTGTSDLLAIGYPPDLVPSDKKNWSATVKGAVKWNTTGTVRFRLYGDDGVRMWVNNTLLIDDWGGRDGHRFTPEIQTVAGEVANIRVDVNNHRGQKFRLNMAWFRNGDAGERVPLTVLYPISLAQADLTPVSAGVQVSYGVDPVIRY